MSVFSSLRALSFAVPYASSASTRASCPRCRASSRYRSSVDESREIDPPGDEHVIRNAERRSFVEHRTSAAVACFVLEICHFRSITSCPWSRAVFPTRRVSIIRATLLTLAPRRRRVSLAARKFRVDDRPRCDVRATRDCAGKQSMDCLPMPRCR